MKCPTDGATLVMSERSGIEIDYCPDCRGIWLDRGELDKIVDRASREVTAEAPAQAQQAVPQQPVQQYSQPPQPQYVQQQPVQGYGQPQYGQPYRKKKKEHWLMELFD